MRFHKYHALGNDYIVLDPADYPTWKAPGHETIRVICHRNFGVGSDGILWGPLPSKAADFGLRIFNPDGSEAEKSGNGLRIFARYLLDVGHVQGTNCRIHTPVGSSEVRYLAPDGSQVEVDMGQPSFRAGDIPFIGM